MRVQAQHRLDGGELDPLLQGLQMVERRRRFEREVGRAGRCVAFGYVDAGVDPVLQAVVRQAFPQGAQMVEERQRAGVADGADLPAPGQRLQALGGRQQNQGIAHLMQKRLGVRGLQRQQLIHDVAENRGPGSAETLHVVGVMRQVFQGQLAGLRQHATRLLPGWGEVGLGSLLRKAPAERQEVARGLPAEAGEIVPQLSPDPGMGGRVLTVHGRADLEVRLRQGREGGMLLQVPLAIGYPLRQGVMGGLLHEGAGSAKEGRGGPGGTACQRFPVLGPLPELRRGQPLQQERTHPDERLGAIGAAPAAHRQLCAPMQPARHLGF